MSSEVEYPEPFRRQMDLWIEERHRDIVGTRFRVKKVLFSAQSEFQNIEIVETQGHGRMLFNDGMVMTSERDEFAYHEMMSHVPLFTHPCPKRVLVIGGGDGGTVREVLKHSQIEKCTLVEIDSEVIRGCKEFLPALARSFSDPRVEVRIEDGVKYVSQFAQSSEPRYDVILVDSTDPIGPAKPLFGSEFYSNVKRCLSQDGIVVAQGESPFYELQTQKQMLKTLGEFFEVVRIYNFSNMTYPGGLWSFSFASQKLCPLRDFKLKDGPIPSLALKYYRPEVHRAAFALPQFMVDELGSVIKN